jgi:DNA-directed RNA polymerase subunit alpha
MVTGPEMIKPQEVDVDSSSLTDVFGKMSIQPLERGYGHTLGNALRRVLLSSLSGAAITGIEVDGALHEFSQVPDVREDLTELILNLKQVRIKMHGEGPEDLTLVVKGPGVATAGDFEGGHNIEILNPSHVLAHIGEGGSLRLRARVETGRGFRSADDIKDADWPIGRIAVDAIFSPVRKVNFEVANARVGQRTDYDRLVFEIQTDGSVAPVEALSIAANLLQDQLTIFSAVKASAAASHGGGKTVAGAVNPVFLKALRDLDLKNRSVNSLHGAGIHFLGDLVQMTEAEIGAISNFGQKSLEEVHALLESLGLALGMKIEGWPPAQLERPEAQEA